ncbi:putative msp domain-containing protein [Phaeoacremonium minimum UCRPA7]|uniref:Putative msp domain-containing protein n=1 Tax=Phaeoacremonium minimum (strain UCR-PA7) TaxID=1286976 RepID=R8BRK3_PHAM7|nr:putative msp domain-containing protein [Phaeoacremonium minimum UCRPA7]EOO01915.1 putative msp domain-containing protein [Phaeoacremonium minimum UCRPA7]
MSVEIDPLELGFRRPFTVEVANILKIRNPNKSPVAFKVKTTAPKQYCVRPNSGRIEPDHEVEVTVLLQAMKQDPPLDTKCRDKFLVQSVNISGDKEFTSVQQIWDSVEKAQIQEKKIRVNFLPAGDSATGPGATPIRQHLSNGVEATPDAPPPAYSSPQTDNIGGSAESPISETKGEPDVAPSVVSGVTAKSSAESNVSDSKPLVAESEGVRQRKGVVGAVVENTPSASELATAVRPPATEGVPVRIVALLCLASFLLAYFFF